MAHGDSGFGRCLAHLARIDLLVIDDFEIESATAGGQHDHLELHESAQLNRGSSLKRVEQFLINSQGSFK